MQNPYETRTRSILRCRTFWRRGVWRVAFALTPLYCVSVLLLLAFGNCQWHKYVYMFQAYVHPEHEYGWIRPPFDFTGTWNAWHKNGQKADETEYQNGKSQGKAIAWHPNGQKYCEGECQNGERYGKWITWHENGQKNWEGEYQNGDWYGKQVWWDIDGQKRLERDFHNESQWKELRWHKNGEKEHEGKYINDKRHGTWRFWNQDGTLTRTEIYDNGKLLQTIKPERSEE